MPRSLYGTPAKKVGTPVVEDEREKLINQLSPAPQPAAPVNNPLGGALADARTAEQVSSTIDYSKIPDISKIATSINMGRNPTTPAPDIAGENGRHNTGSLNKESPAMSREAANSSYANFEDLFNKNTGYAAKYRSQVANALGPEAKEVDPYKPPEKTVSSMPVNQNVSVSGNLNNPPSQSAPGTGGAANTNKQGLEAAPPPAQSTGTSKQALEVPGTGSTTPQNQTTTQNQTSTTIQNNITGGAPATLNNIQAGADAQNAGPGTGIPNTPYAQALLAELNALPTDATQAEQDEVRRLSIAEDLTAALGKDGGKALLSELNGQPVTDYDAAFMNVGGGRNDLDRYKKQFEGATARQEKALTDKYNAVQKRRDEIAQELAGLKRDTDVAETPAAATTPTSTDTKSEEEIPEYTGTNDAQTATYLFGDNNWEKGKALTHAMTMTVGIDGIQSGFMEATDTNWDNMSEAFVGNFHKGAHTAWKWGNLLAGIARVSGWGGAAQRKFITALKRDPALMKKFLEEYKNPGYIANRIKDWFKANGIQPDKTAVMVDRPTAEGTVNTPHGYTLANPAPKDSIITGPKQDASVTATGGGSPKNAPSAPQAPPGQEWTGKYDGKGRPIFKKKGT